MEYKLHKTFLLRGNILHLVKKVIKLDIYIKEYFFFHLSIIIRWLMGWGEGRAYSLSGLARTPECTVCAPTGTKGSSSTSGHDSEGVMKWGLWEGGKEEQRQLGKSSRMCRTASDQLCLLLWGRSFLCSQFPSPSPSLHVGVREQAGGWQWGNWGFQGHTGVSQ